MCALGRALGLYPGLSRAETTSPGSGRVAQVVHEGHERTEDFVPSAGWVGVGAGGWALPSTDMASDACEAGGTNPQLPGGHPLAAGIRMNVSDLVTLLSPRLRIHPNAHRAPGGDVHREGNRRGHRAVRTVTASWTVDVVIMAFVRLMGHCNLLYHRFSVGGYPSIQRSPESVGLLMEVRSMDAKNGDHIIVESAKVGSARRSGQIVEVVQGSAGERYRVESEDGRRTEFFPGPNTMVVPPST